MYFETRINIPDVPGKITVSRKIYVQYETGRKYNREKKFNVPVRVTIGKICSDEEGKMFPTEKYLAFFPADDVPEFDTRPKRSCCLKMGTYLVVKKIIKEYELDEISEKVFHREAGLFLDLACYSIVEEKNAGQYYPDYAYGHPLFTDGHRMYSDAKVSMFLKNMTDDQRIEFLNLWNDGKDKDVQIYVTYDSTNKNCQAGDIDLAEYGHAKDDKNYPIINYSIGYDHANRIPLFYEEYPGSIVDVSQLDYMINKTEGYGYRNIGFINSFVKCAAGTFETDRKWWINKYHVYGKTLKMPLFKTDERDRYIHVYYNRMRAASEQEKFESQIDQMEKQYNKLVGEKRNTEDFEKYFRFERGKDGVIAAVVPKDSVIEKEKSKMGYFVIVTSKKMSAKTALHLYKSRDESEKLFRADKSYLGNDAFRNASDAAIEAKSLVEFVALVIRNRIFTYFDEAIEQGIKKQNFLTVPAAIKELEKIELVRQSDGR